MRDLYIGFETLTAVREMSFGRLQRSRFYQVDHHQCRQYADHTASDAFGRVFFVNDQLSFAYQAGVQRDIAASLRAYDAHPRAHWPSPAGT